MKRVLTGIAAAVSLAGVAQAQQPAAPAEPASPHTITGNVGIFSQYIFRGLTQTNGDPAVQGGFDYSHSSGFYLGTWASNISWLRDNGSYNGGGSLEWDFYGGYKWGFAPDWTLDLGALYYYYPGDVTPVPGFVKADTLEVYAGLSWKWLSAKYWYSVNNKTFGVPDSSGTYYVDFGVNVPLGDLNKEMNGWTVFAHYGIQRYSGQQAALLRVGSNDSLFSYDDWKIGVSYALPKDFTVGVFYTDTSSASAFGYGALGECDATGCGVYPRNIAKGTGTIYLQKTF